MLGWFLIQTRSTNRIGRNYPTFRREVSNRVWGSWYLIIWLEIEFRNAFEDCYFFQTDFRKLLFGLCFWTADFKNHPDSAILQKCQSLSNQSFKHNSAHMPSLNLTSNLFHNIYYTKSKRLQSLDSLLKFVAAAVQLTSFIRLWKT